MSEFAATDERDKRDPKIYGAALLGWKNQFAHPGMRLSEVQDRARLRVRDYESNEGPLEKYGDPRLLPSTLPN